MKKILLLATFSIAGLVSASDSEKIKLTVFKDEVENNSKKPLYCQQYSIETWCNPGNLLVDTVCYEPTNAADRDHAFACMDQNARLANVYFCGRETPRITKDVNIN